MKPHETPSHEELARRAAELGFATSADEYRKIENRLRTLRTTLDVVRGIDVTVHEPASTPVPTPVSVPSREGVPSRSDVPVASRKNVQANSPRRRARDRR